MSTRRSESASASSALSAPSAPCATSATSALPACFLKIGLSTPTAATTATTAVEAKPKTAELVALAEQGLLYTMQVNQSKAASCRIGAAPVATCNRSDSEDSDSEDSEDDDDDGDGDDAKSL